MRTIQSMAFRENLKQLSKERKRRASPDEARTKRLHGYGLTQSAYNVLLSKSGGRCGICNRNNQKLVIDHSHETGEVRGLLCARCNNGLGMFKDSLWLLGRAGEYLSKTGTAIELIEQAAAEKRRSDKQLARDKHREESLAIWNGQKIS